MFGCFQVKCYMMIVVIFMFGVFIMYYCRGMFVLVWYRYIVGYWIV